eukprot:Lankesteria_metandrocarpae@DN2311_c0_g1_i1.p1
MSSVLLSRVLTRTPTDSVGDSESSSPLESGVCIEHTFTKTLTFPKFYRKQEPSMILGDSAHLLKVNKALATDLGFNCNDDSPLYTDTALKVFGGATTLKQQPPVQGTTIPDSDNATDRCAAVNDPVATAADTVVAVAMAYAGHQFGNFVQSLGDGRAVLLGELRSRSTGTLYDVQLKGSGPTPFARNGDGYSALGPVIREYILSEYMHFAGVPTTRALAAVNTGRPVMRQDGRLSGGVFTRVARCLIRVGTFEYFASRGDVHGIECLADYCIKRNFPDITGRSTGGTADRYRQMFHEVVVRQAHLIAQWMSIGFIHGVMNTDNCCVTGDTIDYGPCAFMDAFSSTKTFSAIDTHGRYAWGKQATIGHWNMGRLALALESVLTCMTASIGNTTTTAVNNHVDNSSGASSREAYSSISSSGGSYDPRSDFLRFVEKELACYQTTFENAFTAIMQAKIGMCNSYYTNFSSTGTAANPGTVGNSFTGSGRLAGHSLIREVVVGGVSTVDPLDKALLEMLLTTMEKGKADFTQTFSRLCDVDLITDDGQQHDLYITTDSSTVKNTDSSNIWKYREDQFIDCFNESNREGAKSWLRLWRRRLTREADKFREQTVSTGSQNNGCSNVVEESIVAGKTDKEDKTVVRGDSTCDIREFDKLRRRLMWGVNPKYIPRNHMVERVIRAAVKDSDYTEFNRFVDEVIPMSFGATTDSGTGIQAGRGGVEVTTSAAASSSDTHMDTWDGEKGDRNELEMGSEVADPLALFNLYGRPPRPSEVVQRTFCGT